MRSTGNRYAETAFLRDKTLKEERQRRVIARKKRVAEALRVRKPPEPNDHDKDAKLRSVFSAIRAHTNTDVDLNPSMSPSEIFSATLKALSEPSSDKAAKESKFVGEALELVSRLNGVLSSR
jgi:hypothetical protein